VCMASREYARVIRLITEKSTANVINLRFQYGLGGFVSTKEYTVHEKLVKLRDEIKNCRTCRTCKDGFNPDPWLFKDCRDFKSPNKYPEWRALQLTKVRGFMGTGKVSINDRDIRVMFVAFRPSKAKIDCEEGIPTCQSQSFYGFKMFYKMLGEHGFADAHLTDLIKCRRGIRVPISECEAKNCVKFIKSESDYGRDVVVAVGNRVRDILPFLQAQGVISCKAELEHIPHYARQTTSRKYDLAFQKLKERVTSKFKK
jgi:hypothetical protein